VLSALNSNGLSNVGNITANAGTNSTVATGGIASVTDFSSLVALLVSFGALRDWLKLIVVGGVVGTLSRVRLVSRRYSNISNPFFLLDGLCYVLQVYRLLLDHRPL
jgi:chaperone BCS1